jgi:putative membrane protein
MGTMNTTKQFGTIVCLSALLSIPAFAADDGLKHQDRSFIDKAAKAGMEEVSISRIAAERSQNPQVKDFAQMMVSDHGGANAELTTLATTKGVKLPADDTNTKKWSERSAKDFDQEYVDKMVGAHKDAVKLFKEEAKDGSDPELKAFAAKTLPTLETHLEKVESLKKEVK